MELTGVDKVVVSENNYRISTLKSRNIISDIVTLISNADGEITNIVNEQPTLESVFLALTGKALRE